MRKLYRIVTAIIRDKNKILLVNNKDEYSDFLWSLPGGQIEVGENLEEALFREVFEETGLTINEYSLAYITENFVEKFNAHSLVTYFQCDSVSGNIVLNDPDNEIIDYTWVEIERIKKYITNEDISQPLIEYFKKEDCKQYYLFTNMEW